MKSIRLQLAFALCAIFLALPLVPACATANKAAYKATQGVSIAGTLAQDMWADYVAAQKRAGTPVPLAQEIQAKRAWNALEDAKDASFSAGIAYAKAKESGVADLSPFLVEVRATGAAFAASQAEFIALIRSFGVKL